MKKGTLGHCLDPRRATDKRSMSHLESVYYREPASELNFAIAARTSSSVPTVTYMRYL